jgi:hypothetical protein
MSRRILSFFATRDDLIDVLRPIEAAESFRYVQEGAILAGHERPVWNFAEGIPDLGIAKDGDQAGEMSWLLVPENEALRPELVVEYSGRRREIVDQSTTPASVELTAGGIFKVNVIIPGRIATISDDTWSQRMHGRLARAFRKRFRRIQSYWVGKQAEAMFRSGARLTFRAASPPEYDLREE